MKEIKSILLKNLPNNEDVFTSNLEDIIINDIEYILWSIRREGKTIWIEMEDNSPFGKSMQGRYYINYVDINPLLYPYIIDRFIINNNLK